MDLEDYRQYGKEMVDYIADYLRDIRSRRVYPAVSPGYLRNVLPASAPVDGESWEDIFADVEKCIMPGVTHWQSPHMHAYFPALNSPASLLGDMLADAINCLGFTWASSPACTELETIIMNWLGKMIGLPEDFLHQPGGSGGGGVIQTTASEATLVCLLAARTRAIRDVQENDPDCLATEINSRLVAYCSDQAHSSVEKAGLIGLVRMRYIKSDSELSMRGDALLESLTRDRAEGLLPFFVCATLGTTGACSFDNLKEIGPICQQNGLWLHVDAAYAGSAFICPEFRSWLQGVEFTDSIAFNPSKWLMVHFDCTAMWVKNSQALHRTFNVDPLYLKHENSGLAIDYMHWQIPLSKRFRALKLWFVIRNYGITGLQKHIREGVRLAQKFEALVLADARFEIPAPRHLGMVVFRLLGENTLTERLLKKLNSRGRLHCVPAALHGKYVIRFTVTSTNDLWVIDYNGSVVSSSKDAIISIRRRIRGILMSGKQFSLDSRMDLVQGYVCSRPLSDSPSELPLMKEDEDAGLSESIFDVDAMDESENDKSIVYKNWEDSDNSETTEKELSVSKSDSSYTVTNGSFINIGTKDNGDNTVTIASADVGFPRSETIAAFGHRPYTGDLVPVRVLEKKLMKENKEDDGKGELCRKCGHYSKRQ
ncbi:PREDICTED: histidine decarboxylase [Atta cephalotes]|uniref:Histidine decarboxylase n=1 Tax=Atta cephalotes TaxID=12957 RepID=A0A158NPI6_ATTCE|nr:PREDICTED: histidine decarboxylase [Atta cephalotes]